MVIFRIKQGLDMGHSNDYNELRQILPRWKILPSDAGFSANIIQYYLVISNSASFSGALLAGEFSPTAKCCQC